VSDGFRTARERIEEALSARVDRCLDRELSAEECAALYEDLKASPEQARRLAETHAALDMLRAPVETPDLTAGILHEVGLRRGWLSARLQRVVTVGRLAAAACLLLALTVVLTAKRAAPDAAVFQAGPAPVSDLINAGQTETRDSVKRWSDTVSHYRALVAAPRASEPRRAGVRWAAGGAVFLSNSGWVSVSRGAGDGCDERRRVRRACASSDRRAGQAFRVVFSVPCETSGLVKARFGRLSSSDPGGVSDDESSPVGGW